MLNVRPTFPQGFPHVSMAPSQALCASPKSVFLSGLALCSAVSFHCSDKAGAGAGSPSALLSHLCLR